MGHTRKPLSRILVILAIITLFILCQHVVGLPTPSNCDNEGISKPIFLQLSNDDEVTLSFDSASETTSDDDDGTTESNSPPSRIFKKAHAIMVNNHIIQDINKEFTDIFTKAKYTSRQITRKLSELTAKIQSKVSDAVKKVHLPKFNENSRKIIDTKEEHACNLSPSKEHDIVLIDLNMTNDDLAEYHQMSLDHDHVYEEISKVLNVTIEYVKKHPYIVVDILLIVFPLDYALLRLLEEIGFTYLNVGRWIPDFFARFLRFLGFSYPGIIKDSLAARWMARFGGEVPAGSRLSLLQSLGAKLGRVVH